MHDHEHVHDSKAAHVHAHPHGETNAMSPEETLALLNYMLDHNRHHADELHDVCHSLEANGKTAAAEKLAEALHHFDHSNLLLAEAVALSKETE